MLFGVRIVVCGSSSSRIACMHLVAREFVAAARCEHRIEDQRNVGIVGHDLGDRGDVLDAAEHADLERVDRHVLEQAARLVGDPVGVDRLHAFDAQRVLHRDRRDDRQRMAAHARERQDVGLHSRAAGRIGRRERQHERRKFRIVVGRHCVRSAWVGAGNAIDAAAVTVAIAQGARTLLKLRFYSNDSCAR